MAGHVDVYGNGQLLSLATIVDHLTTFTPPAALLGSLNAFADARAARASAPMDREGLADEARHCDEELLLIRVQNVRLPMVRDGAIRAEGPSVSPTMLRAWVLSSSQIATRTGATMGPMTKIESTIPPATGCTVHVVHTHALDPV